MFLANVEQELRQDDCAVLGHLQESGNSDLRGMMTL